MNKIFKRLLLIMLFNIAVISIVYGLVIPKILESRVPEMKKFLNDVGYENPKMSRVIRFSNQVEFKTDKGTVFVVTTRNGGFSIKYN